MAKTSRASKAPSSKTWSNLIDESVTLKSSATPKRSSKSAHSISPGQPSTSMAPYQVHAIPGVNPQQHPQVQIVHLPYSYPYVLHAASPYQTRPLATPQPHPQPDLRPSPQPQPHPSSSSATSAQPPTLESVFRETIQKLHDLETTLSNTQAITKRALVRHQYELQKWKTHCVAFKQERDAARDTIKSLMEERAKLLKRQPNIPPEMSPTYTAPSTSAQPATALAKLEPVEAPLPASPRLSPILTDLSREQRKASRASRRHSPYSSPTAGPSRRPSSSHNLPTFDCARWDPSIYPISPRARASSSPPSLSALHEPQQPISSMCVENSIPSETPAVDERLQGLEFTRFEPTRREGDDTALDVTWLPSSEPMELEYPVSRSSSVRAKPAEDSDSDMELESDEEADAETPHSGPSTSMFPPAPAKPTLNIDRIDLLFAPAAGRIWCRLCMLEQSNRTAARPQLDGVAGVIDPNLTNFRPNASWPELRDHWTVAHPSESERLAALSYEELWKLRDSRAQPSVSQS